MNHKCLQEKKGGDWFLKKLCVKFRFIKKYNNNDNNKKKRQSFKSV